MDYSKLFLVRLYNEYRSFFWVCVVFIIFQFMFSVKRVQNFPFFTFDMYSRPVEVPNKLNKTTIKLDDLKFDFSQLNPWTEYTLINTFDLFRFYKLTNQDVWAHTIIDRKNKYFFLKGLDDHQLINAKEDYDKYPKWVFDFLENSLNTETKKNSLEFLISTYEVKNRVLVLKEEKSEFKINNNEAN